MKNRKKKKKNSRITFLIIPQSAAKPLRWNVSEKSISVALVLAALLILTTGTIGYLYHNSQEEIRNVENIKKDNLQKDETIELLSEEIKAIEEQQQNINSKQEEIKHLMGIKTEKSKDTTPSRGGQGGFEKIRSNDEESEVLYLVQDIKTSLAKQEQELDELLAMVNNNTDYFRSVPNQWPAEGEISSNFGWRKSPFGGRSESFHDGIDIANNSGINIVAAADGTVISTGWQGAYGKTIIIDHGFGFKTKYGHNSTILVDEGEKVKKGQVVAKMGTTGRSTGPHLHFTVFKWDNPQDPMIYLSPAE